MNDKEVIGFLCFCSNSLLFCLENEKVIANSEQRKVFVMCCLVRWRCVLYLKVVWWTFIMHIAVHSSLLHKSKLRIAYKSVLIWFSQQGGLYPSILTGIVQGQVTWPTPHTSTAIRTLTWVVRGRYICDKLSHSFYPQFFSFLFHSSFQELTICFCSDVKKLIFLVVAFVSCFTRLLRVKSVIIWHPHDFFLKNLMHACTSMKFLFWGMGVVGRRCFDWIFFFCFDFLTDKLKVKASCAQIYFIITSVLSERKDVLFLNLGFELYTPRAPDSNFFFFCPTIS